MTKRIFIWVAHPRAGSLNAGLAAAYAEGAEAAGAEVRVMQLSEMTFEKGFEGYGPKMPALEPDLLRWQEALAWADHVLVVHPYWWGGMPASAKALLDRALTPGFAYKYHARGVAWDKLLAGKTGDVVITSDTPPLIDRFVYGRPGLRVMANQILGFCGIKVRTKRQFGSVKLAGPRKIDGWLKTMRKLGAKAGAARPERTSSTIRKRGLPERSLAKSQSALSNRPA